MATDKARIQEATLEKFLAAWKDWSAEGQIAVFTDDVQQRTLPFSLGIPPRNKDNIRATLPRIEEVVTNYQLNVHHIVHDPKRNLASILATSSGDSLFGDWRQEYAVYLRFDASGEKICQIDEMMDASFIMEFTPQFQDYLANNPRLETREM
ncbi:hypothetical protein CKM354_000796100 [Cercospora kikuchii]|uniref:SnoaL-like domain-containing protein n=1 Tax=Cercospora kikuchii TaxID=84275 RepID=A0A9P3CKB0_9PEZI|nr:uncharacterized protein CKM354_000796100 [Cercospora kikuchii]GIZ44772.1 hypothetical protein CKM354_000796100 [Cercospora kikuchii]